VSIQAPGPRRQPGSLGARIANGAFRISAKLGQAEPELLGLSAIVREGDTVFDVGAAWGMYTAPLARLVGARGRVFAFEPQGRQTVAVRSLRGFMGARHVTVTKAVLGPEEGVVTLMVPFKFGVPIFGWAHVVEGTDPSLERTTRSMLIRTPMHSVDAWMTKHGAPDPTFLKIDVEGFEPGVIDGAAATITRALPSLLLEIEDRHLLRYGTDGNAFADDLRRRWPDYRMYTWVDGAWTPTERVTLATRNYLFATDAALSRPRGATRTGDAA
jgi:FkbM family methyltransferase